jgi:hypothetical protein
MQDAWQMTCQIRQETLQIAVIETLRFFQMQRNKGLFANYSAGTADAYHLIRYEN